MRHPLLLFQLKMSMGTCFGIVRYVDGPNVGSVAGIVSAGGNAGGALLGLIFLHTRNYGLAMEVMGWLTVSSALLTPFIVIKGYRGIIFGEEEEEDSNSKVQHSPLVIPGKMQHSPHLVVLRRKQRKADGLKS